MRGCALSSEMILWSVVPFNFIFQTIIFSTPYSAQYCLNMDLCDCCIKRIQSTLKCGVEGQIQDKLPCYPQLYKQSCWMCKKLVSWVQETHPTLFKKWRGSPLTVIFKLSSWAMTEDRPSNLGHLLPCEVEVIPLFQGELVDDYGCMISMDFMSEEDVAHLVNILSRHRPLTLDLGLIQGWIENCKRNHRRCTDDLSKSWYPTRLLHINSGRRLTGVKLVVTKNMRIKGPYITLSHRWAPHAHRFPMLRPSTVYQFQKGIDARRLPRAFQDAIELTRQLGVSYLWIDSLCIIQDEDDHSDWDRECLTMDKVYSHAFLNISATLSQTGSESLFNHYPSQALSLPPRIDLSADGKGKKHYILNSNFWHDEISNGPLNNRGWVFQERFLACRVLHFGQRQVGWECQVSEAMETFPDGLPPSLSVGSRSKPGNHETIRKASQVALFQAQIGQNGLPISSATDLQFIEWWHCLVEDYSRCKFTYIKDKLIALSGVAKYVAKNRPVDRYLAGMWQSCMVYGMAWFRIHDSERTYSNNSSFEFHAPSWSWASFDGEVCFPTITPGNPKCFARVVHIADDPMFPEGAVNANASMSPYAYISIKIESFLFPLHVDWAADSILEVMLVDFGICFSENDDLFGTKVDIEEDEILKNMMSQHPFFLVPLYATSYFLQAIILVREEGQSNVYHRLGGIEIPLRIDEGIDNENSDNMHLNWNALYLIQYMEEQNKGVETKSGFSVFEIS